MNPTNTFVVCIFMLVFLFAMVLTGLTQFVLIFIVMFIVFIAAGLKTGPVSGD